METTLPRVLCAGAGERTPDAGWARQGRAQGRASVGCSRGAGAAPFRAAGTWPRGCSLGEAGDGDGGGEPNGGSQPRTEVTGRSSPPHSLFPLCAVLSARAKSSLTSAPSPNRSAAGARACGGETPRVLHAGTQTPLPGGFGPLQPLHGSVAPFPVCGERQGAGWVGGSRIPRREPGSPAPSAWLVPQALSKKRQAGRCFAGSGRGRHVGAGWAGGLGPCGEGRATRDGLGGGRGCRGQPLSGMLALGTGRPSGGLV